MGAPFIPPPIVLDKPGREAWLDKYAGLGDLAALAQCFADLGTTGGIVRLPANRTVDLSAITQTSPLVVPDFVTIRGSTPMPDQPRGTYAFDFTNIAKVLLPSLPSVTFITAADTPIGQGTIALPAAALNTLAAGMIVTANGPASGVTTSAAAAVGATSIPVTTTGVVNGGDIIQFAGDTNQYIVKTGTNGGGTIILDAPLLAAVASGVAMNTLAGASLLPGTLINNVSKTNGQIVLNLATVLDLPQGSIITVTPQAIVLGNSAGLEDLTLVKAGMATPAASNAAALAEVQTWANGGTAVCASGYGSRVLRSQIVGFKYAIVVPRVNRQRIEHNTFDAWNKMVFGPSGDLAHVRSNHGWPLYTINQPWSLADATQQRGGTGFLASSSSDLRLIDCFDIGSFVGYRVNGSQYVALVMCFADSYAAAVQAKGLWVDGASPFFSAVASQFTGYVDCVHVDLYAWSGGTASALTYGAARLSEPTVASTGGRAGYRLTRGGMHLAMPSAQAVAKPVLLEDGCTIFSCFHPSFNQAPAASNAFTLPPTSVPSISKIGGTFASYVDNLGDFVTNSLLLSYSANLSLGSVQYGPQIDIVPNTVNPTGRLRVWGTAGGAHYGVVSGAMYYHTSSGGFAHVWSLGYTGTITQVGQLTPYGFQPALKTALVATGTNQAGALVLATKYSILTSVPAGAGCILPVNFTSSFDLVGAELVVINRGANDLNVYPPSGGQIEANAVNAPVKVTAGSTGKFVCEATGLWRQV